MDGENIRGEGNKLKRKERKKKKVEEENGRER